ncbi:MAG: DUF2489 domain-containing protein [Gammaproteobacteria bacterium]
MQYATQWHVLGTIGVAIVLGLAAYAIHLWVRLAGQSVTPPAAPSACQTGGRDRDHALIESIQIIATAMRTGDCNLSEGCIRLRYLLDHLDPGQRLRPRLEAVYAHYEAIAHMPVREARKALKLSERNRLDREREALEIQNRDAILDAVVILLDDDDLAASVQAAGTRAAPTSKV